jgi:putative phage-type endonuclease
MNNIFNLSDDELMDLEIETHDFIGNYYDENIINLYNPNFYDVMVSAAASEMYDLCLCLSDDFDDYENDAEYFEKFQKQVRIYVGSFFDTFGLKRRSYRNPRPHNYLTLDAAKTKQNIEYLKTRPQPAQRTPEWYVFRHGLISASNIWKVFGSDATRNSLIYEKCKPLHKERSLSIDLEDDPAASEAQTKFVNTQSTLHWGCKYERLSTMIYEYRNGVKVDEFGCIQHDKYPFIGASPDGIVTTENHELYGRMLEIKNIVNREINGIPSMDYWIQMQLQMEVAGLEECDFLETRFKEYDDTEEDRFYKEKHNYLYNGVILYFIKRDYTDNSPYYVYMPLDIPLKRASINSWIEMQKKELKDTYVLFRRIYWYCDEYSCVLVHRNKEWFKSALPKIEAVWKTIEEERITGYEHRKPKKRNEIIGTLNMLKPGCMVVLDGL